MDKLLSKKCIPCSLYTDPLNKDEILKYMKDLDEGWEFKENKYIEKPYKFKDFQEALDFINLVGSLSEKEGHHPDICLVWGGASMRIKHLILYKIRCFI